MPQRTARTTPRTTPQATAQAAPHLDLDTLIAEAEARGEQRGRMAARQAARRWLERIFRMYSLVNGLLYAIIGVIIFILGQPNATLLRSSILWGTLFSGAGLLMLQSLVRPDLLALRRMAVMGMVGVTMFAAIVSIINTLDTAQTRSSVYILIMFWLYLLSEHFIAVVSVYQDEAFPSAQTLLARLGGWLRRVSALGLHGCASAFGAGVRHGGDGILAAIRRLRYDADASQEE